MAQPGVAQARHALGRAGDRALRRIARAGDELRVHVLLARVAQRLEGRRIASALGQAVAAVPERVRASRETALGKRVVGEPEGFAQVTAHVLADRQRVELTLRGAVQQATCSVLLVVYLVMKRATP